MLSELGRNEGQAGPKEAFILPATLIRPHLVRVLAVREARVRGRGVLDAIGASDAPLSEMPARLQQFIESATTRAEQAVRPSNDGIDIDAAIGAARGKLGAVDPAGALAVLQAKINEEERNRRRRLLPLLKERAAIERIAFNYEQAKATLTEITRLDPDDVWAWIDLGDLWVRTGLLTPAVDAFDRASGAAQRVGDDRDLSVSHERIGGIQRAQGNLTGALQSYRASLDIRQRLAAQDPNNAEWQRDLSISHDNIGGIQQAQGDLTGALQSHRASLDIRQRLAAQDPNNAEWQRDLSISHEISAASSRRRAI